MKSNAVKIGYLVAAFICFAVGVAGVILPLLPGIPFLFLGMYCLSRGSRKMHRWILDLPGIKALKRKR